MTTDAFDPPADDRPQRHLVTSRAELARAVQVLAERAQRSLRCCAATGAVFDLDAAPRVASLRRLVLAHRQARIQLLVDDPAWIETRAPRFKALQRAFAHAVQLRAANPQDPVGEDLQLLVDDRDGLVLRAGAAVSGELWFNHQHRARPLLADFDRRWAAASHDLPVVPLGL